MVVCGGAIAALACIKKAGFSGLFLGLCFFWRRDGDEGVFAVSHQCEELCRGEFAAFVVFGAQHFGGVFVVVPEPAVVAAADAVIERDFLAAVEFCRMVADVAAFDVDVVVVVGFARHGVFLREEVGRADFARDVQGALVACAADAKCAVKVAEDFEVAIGGVEVVGLNVAADGEVESGVVQQRALQGEVAVDDDVVAVGGGVQFGQALLRSPFRVRSPW